MNFCALCVSSPCVLCGAFFHHKEHEEGHKEHKDLIKIISSAQSSYVSPVSNKNLKLFTPFIKMI